MGTRSLSCAAVIAAMQKKNEHQADKRNGTLLKKKKKKRADFINNGRAKEINCGEKKKRTSMKCRNSEKRQKDELDVRQQMFVQHQPTQMCVIVCASSEIIAVKNAKTI